MCCLCSLLPNQALKDWKLLLALGVILGLDVVCLTITTVVERWRLSAVIVDTVSGAVEGWEGEGCGGRERRECVSDGEERGRECVSDGEGRGGSV